MMPNDRNDACMMLAWFPKMSHDVSKGLTGYETTTHVFKIPKHQKSIFIFDCNHLSIVLTSRGNIRNTKYTPHIQNDLININRMLNISPSYQTISN